MTIVMLNKRFVLKLKLNAITIFIHFYYQHHHTQHHMSTTSTVWNITNKLSCILHRMPRDKHICLQVAATWY